MKESGRKLKLGYFFWDWY